MLGRAAVAMWWDIAPEMKAEFEDWHSHEHMPERLRIPGFLRGTRWIALSGEPSYFILYEAARLATITSGAYLERLNNPTPWSRKTMPHHRNMVRSLCRVKVSFGAGVADTLATIRFSPRRGRRKAIAEWMASLPARKGLTCVHLLESQPAGTSQTTEQKIRGQDLAAEAVLLVGGYDAETVKAVVAGELRDELFGPRIGGFYRPAFSLISKDEP
jgi:hypothetical protein